MHDCMTQEDASKMDNEQAIQILKPLRDTMIDQHGCPISSAVFALDKAIEALSAQSEATEEEVKEYCRKRCLCIVDSALLKKYASAQPELSDVAVSAMAVEEMLKDLLPKRGMWEIEGDEAKTAVCEVIRDALEGLWKLPFVKPNSKESSLTQKELDIISRQAAIDALIAWEEDYDWDEECLAHRGEPLWVAPSDVIERLPPAQPEVCEGCKHLGKWENEVEYGYPSPCTRCKRRVEDNYER